MVITSKTFKGKDCWKKAYEFAMSDNCWTLIEISFLYEGKDERKPFS